MTVDRDELKPCPLSLSDEELHELRLVEEVRGRAIRHIIYCSCGIVFNGAYGDAGSPDGATNARASTIRRWNRRALSATEAQAEPVAWRYRLSYDGSWEFWPTEAWNGIAGQRFQERHPEAEPLYVSPHTGNGGVEVEPLEWKGDGSGFVKEESECVIGLYRISQSRITNDWRWSLNALDGPWSLALPTREAAKAGAQLDYENHIRGALA